MKLHFLNSFKKRALFSIALSIVITIIGYFIYGIPFISLFSILFFAVCIFLPLTLIYAIVSTFFNDNSPEDSSDILDR